MKPKEPKENHHCPRCKGLPECACTCKPDYRSGHGRNVGRREMDVWELTHTPAGYRLAMGFRMLRDS